MKENPMSMRGQKRDHQYMNIRTFWAILHKLIVDFMKAVRSPESMTRVTERITDSQDKKLCLCVVLNLFR